MKVTHEKPSSPKVKRLQKFIHLHGSQDVTTRSKTASTSTMAQSLSLNTLPSLQALQKTTPSSLQNLDTGRDRSFIGSITILNDSVDKPGSIEIGSTGEIKNPVLVKVVKNLDTSVDKHIERNPKDRHPLLHRGTSHEFTINRTFNNSSKPSRPSISDEYKLHRREQIEDDSSKMIEKRMKYMKEQVNEFLQSGLGVPEINQQLKVCFTHFKMVAEKLHSKFIVMPDTEKEIMGGFVETELYLVKLLTNIKRIMQRQNISVQSLTSQFQSSKKMVERLTKELQATKDEAQAARLSYKKEAMESAPKRPDAPEMVWVIEKLQMSTRIEALEEEVMKLTEQIAENELKVASPVIIIDDTKINDLESEVEKKDNKVFKMNSLLALVEVKNKELSLHAKEVEKNYADLEEKYNSLQKTYEEIMTSESIYKETAWMSREDICQKDEKYQALLQKSKELQRQCFENQYKLGRNKRDFNDFHVLTNDESDKDTMIFEIAKDVINAKDASKRPVLHGLLMDSVAEITNEIKPNSKEQIEIPMEKLALYKPTYYSLIQEEYATYKDEALFDPEDGLYPLNRTCLATMRAILDSKYNELRHYDDPRQCSSFSEFVCSWLNNFYVCPVDKTTKFFGASSQVDAEKRRVGFYKFLCDPKLERTWDVSVFKDFLEEKCGMDEIFFYLHCRYMLYEGEQLNHLAASLIPIDWIPLDRCKRVARCIFEDLNPEQYKILLIKFKERARKKNDKVLVDPSIALKAFLEVYKSQRRVKLQSLQSTFESLVYNGLKKDCIISFNDYKRVMDISYPSVSDIEKVKLYREAWCIGNGKVDPKILIIAANESNLFLYDVRDMTQKSPFFKSMEYDSDYKTKVADVKTMINSRYTQFAEAFAEIKSFAGSLGVESVFRRVESIEKNLKNQLVSSGDTKYVGLSLLFSDLLQISSKVQSQYFSLHRNSIEDTTKILDSQAHAFESLVKSLIYYQDIAKVDLREKNMKARKIQMFFKKKKTNWYSIVKFLMPNLLDKKS